MFHSRFTAGSDSHHLAVQQVLEVTLSVLGLTFLLSVQHIVVNAKFLRRAESLPKLAYNYGDQIDRVDVSIG